ncbi:hypothetical protein [Rhodovulum euryhalinum]|uniref:Uncharacterized protein n=1 Tax=Rhodovulum euryhalinum TaxID=35805 RepID=A0A4R2KNF0_9RHOB|nr:hypothetical protein [Rhodovulum euryhalinum]TCO71598.1 hypothetical protein EV655_10690 [Rhodovulum euryhalinum]
MKNIPLDRAERALLAVIRELDAESGTVDRDALSVRARGRGLEVARPLATLVGRGLVEEIQRRPFFLARVFGARPALLLKPTPAGLAVDCGTEPEAASETALSTPPAPQAAPEVPVTAPQAADAEGPAAVALDETTATAPQAAARVADAPSDGAAENSIEDPGAETGAAPAPAEMPRPRPARPDRKLTKAFTEDLGGAPAATGGVALSHGVESEVMDGIRDVLAGFGMELTFAGEALVGERISRGETAGDALSQVVLFAFAHAVREDLATGGSLGALGLGDYAAEVADELRKLHSAGLVGEDRLTHDLGRIIALTEDGNERERLAAEVLSDPVGGLLPTALLPEELRPAGEM